MQLLQRRLPRRVTWSVVGVLLAVMVVWGAPAVAGNGIAVVLDLPAEAKVGASGLMGSLTIKNINALRDQAATNLVSGINVRPSCGSRGPSADCPGGAEDPGVIAIDYIAVGRGGSACDGTIFTVTETNSATGQAKFVPPNGFVTLGSVTGTRDRSECIIDFTFSVIDIPLPDSTSGTDGAGVDIAAYAGARVTTPGFRMGSGGNWTSLRVN